MSALVLGPEHWRAAQQRRAGRQAHAAPQNNDNRRPTLDEILNRGPWWPPHGGDAA